MTHFGFKTILKSQKQSAVASIFSAVAPSYDVMNDAMSFGIHRSWKDYLIKVLGGTCETRLLDVAGGTGDIGLRFIKQCGGSVSILDINEEMLKVGKQKANELPIKDRMLHLAV